MLKFYLTTILFILCLVLFYTLSLLPFMKLFLLVLSCVIYIGILIWSSSYIGSKFYVNSINKCNNSLNHIAITFDDGPDSDNTYKILELLEKYNSKATFFIIGAKADKNTELMRAINNHGHTIGNHSYNHLNRFPLQLPKHIIAEIIKTNKVIKEITNKENIYFRPPFGVTNPLIAIAIRNMGLRVIGWSIRSFDTMGEDTHVVVNRIKKKVRVGDIILLHENSKNILEILNNLLEYLESVNIKSVSIEELLLKDKC
ncbi:MAG: hypothetical protein A2X12_10500 [Bacteroidetes bacterium GWE2_29_8]|nr:MAG: hypothetical protein A2X12_10500 [Bacteroidetes bacterium GWE2_29_8]OFY23214.1 MAG: hypothetical protein A2X02_09465 [Bacteroidetes bacterium GWF2_29_10]